MGLKRTRGEFRIDKMIDRLEKERRLVPKEIGTLAVGQFKKNLRREGFEDNGLVSWPEVNRRKPGHKQFKKRQQQKKLVGFQGKGGNSASPGFDRTIRIDLASWSKIVVASFGKKYAAYHNSGTSKIPKRQFMGSSKKLERKIKMHLEQSLKGVFTV